VVEIGWSFLARSHWGGATNREMKRLMLEHALAQVARVEFRVGESNLRSRRAMEKIGGRLTGRSEMVDTPSGQMRHVIYEITRESFADGPLKRG
jgi:RimJ/RimL family protein N-acetyltransferase